MLPDAKSVRRQITREEFFDLREAGQTITNCVIEADWLASALAPAVSADPDAATERRRSPNDGFVVLEDVEVKGDFVIGSPDPHLSDRFSGLPKYRAEIPSGIVILDCSFSGKVDLAGRFHGPVVFAWCHFAHELAISDSQFDVECGFTNCVGKHVRLKVVTFSSLEMTWNTFPDVVLDRCSVKKDARFQFGDEGPQAPNFSCWNSNFDSQLDVSGSHAGTFRLDSAKIGGDAAFNEFGARDAFFSNVAFGGNVDFDHAIGGEVDFYGNSFKGRASFFSAKFDKITFRPGHSWPSSVPFDGPATFDGIQCESGKFDGADFHGPAQFVRAGFQKSAIFKRVRFSGDVDFRGATFPTSEIRASLADQNHQLQEGFVLDDVTFDKSVYASWDQFVRRDSGSASVLGCNSATWRSLENALGHAGELEAQNEVLYQRRLAGYADDPNENRLTNWVAWAYWGYGVRPARLAGWLCALVVGFAIIYYTQTRPLAVGASFWRGWWNRLSFAVAFSANTAFRLNYGYRNSNTAIFKSLTVVESLIAKLIVLNWVQVVANQSLVLKDIGKVLGI